MSSTTRGNVALLAFVALALTAGCASQPARLATAQNTANPDVHFVNWLKDYVPAQNPGVKIDDHGHWFQAKIPSSSLTVSWAELSESRIALKKVESVREGKSLFIAKGTKDNWANVPGAVYFDNSGYYVSGYVAATMGDWEVGKITVVQFDGDSRKFAEDMAKAWTRAQKQ
jgi:hypothetical protein